MIIFWDLRSSRGRSRDSAVSTATRLRVRLSGVRIPVGTRFFSYLNVQTGSRVHLASYAMGTRDSFPEEQRPRFRIQGTIHLLPQYAFAAWSGTSYYLMFIFATLCVLFYCVCTAVLHTLVAGLLARSQYPEDPATGHIGTGFSWFPCV
jgi:hypothetical protein